MSVDTAPPDQATTRAQARAVPLPALPRHWTSLGRAIVHTARAHRDRLAVADSLGTELTYGDVLLRALVLGRVLDRELGPRPYVGVMIPPTAGAIVTNIALTLRGRVPVNLNYTTGQDVLDSSVDQAGMTHVITSKRAIDKFPCRPRASLVLLEEIPKKVTTADKLWAAALARAVPSGLLGAFLPGLRGDRRDEPATVIFTSGSTGQPKGVVLTQGNVLSNVWQIGSHVQLIPDEVILGILPLFHSFGFTVTFWTALLLGKRAVYHIDPRRGRTIGGLIEQHRVTMVAASPTFMQLYSRECTPEQFATVRLPMLGSEKLYPKVEADIRNQLGIVPLEGYGCTETGPVVSVNTPHPMRTPDGRTVDGNRPGTVGLLVPGTEVKTTDPDTGADLPVGAEGLIHVRGPQIMKGYLNQPSATAEVLQDGWYNTGDVGRIDADGFLSITGRIKRFSKIGGEMVPLDGVQSAILGMLEQEHPHLAVTALPDPKRGERLIVLYTELHTTPQEICRRLADGPLPKLWLPSPEDFIRVEAIPVLATGKVDLKALRRLAEQHVAP